MNKFWTEDYKNSDKEPVRFAGLAQVDFWSDADYTAQGSEWAALVTYSPVPIGHRSLLRLHTGSNPKLIQMGVYSSLSTIKKSQLFYEYLKSEAFS